MRAIASRRCARWAAGAVLLIAACSPSPAETGRELEVTIEDFEITPHTTAVASGTVTFDVWNRGPTTHEFVVAELDEADAVALGKDGSRGAYAYGRGSADVPTSDRGAASDASYGGVPLGADGLSVDEDAIAIIGELEEVDDGAYEHLTVDLDPGRYVLFCNLEGHYLGGMHASVVVTDG